jgi:hypothetical protein
MNCPKRIEFEYDLANNDRDVIIDSLGDMPRNDTRNIMWLREKSWAVTQVLTQKSDTGLNSSLRCTSP